ncbi:MAG TPA: hypothetical protein VKT83_12505 [bacterium]|nr:hypothetical protein [bacterium]
MRQRILLVLVVLVAIIPLAAGHPWRPAVGAASVVPGVALADISLGAPIGEILTRFGTPSVVRLTGGNGLLGYGFDRYGITVYAHGDIVQAVATTNSVLGGVDGIALGTPLSEVVRILGDVYSRGTVEGYPGIVYGSAGVAFGIDHDAVASILVFKAASAAPLQPASPTSSDGPITSQGGAASPVVADATAVDPGSLPDVSRMKAYSAETRFLSLAGYLRYLVHDTSKTWITSEDTDRLMRQASRSATP